MAVEAQRGVLVGKLLLSAALLCLFNKISLVFELYPRKYGRTEY